MKLNSIVFPKPEASYSKSHPNLIYVDSIQKPKGTSFFSSSISSNDDQVGETHKIPCIEIRFKASEIYLLYFHGNAEDLQITNSLSKINRGYTNNFLLQLQMEFFVNMVSMEYPTYGIYTGDKSLEPNQELIEEDAVSVYTYLTQTRKISEANIIVFGRSMGSGSACFIASKFNPRCLILMSAFASLQDVALQHASILGYLLKQRFPNAQRARSIFCPTLLIHGKSDTLISYRQSEQIFANLASKTKETHYPPLMTHNEFDMTDDLETPIRSFLSKIFEQTHQRRENLLIQDPKQAINQYQIQKIEQIEENKQAEMRWSNGVSLTNKKQ